MTKNSLLTVPAAATLVLGLTLVAPPAVADHAVERVAGDTATIYTNPVSADFADTYADPAVIRGKDGWWYAYGTTDPLFEGEGTRHLLPISRSMDLVDWEYVGDAFTEETLPDWADAERGAALWAPDIRYVNGEYRLYYVVTETTVTGEPNDNAIGVATASSPTGPWTDSGAPVVGPRRGGAGEPGNFLWTFDPSHVVGPDGTEYLFYGSYYGGIWVTELSEDGLRAVGEPTMVAIDNKYEGSFVMQHDGYWYLFVSSANCCAGPTTGYSVHVGRSESITGPYVDREGVPLNQSRAGGTPVIAPNGNQWVGTGHNAVVTDLAGQDWFVYHAIDRNDPYLDGTDGINERPMLLDRLDWIDGWPTVNAGAWASDDPQVGPVTGGRWATTFSDDIDGEWRELGDWEIDQDAHAGEFALLDAVASTPAQGSGQANGHGKGTSNGKANGQAKGHGKGKANGKAVGHGKTQAGRPDKAVGNGQRAPMTALVTRHAVSADPRVQADVRLAPDAAPAPFGLVAAQRRHGEQITAAVDPATNELVVTVTMRQGNRLTATAQRAPLAPDFQLDEWHTIVLEIRDGVAHAEVSYADLGNPLAVVDLELPAGTRTDGAAGAFGSAPGVHVDNLSAVPMTPEVTERVDTIVPGTLDEGAGVEFDGGDLGAGWTVIRDPEFTVADGALVWATEAADLVGPGNDAGLLLREPPEGDWTAETKVTIDLGTDTVRNFQQAGLIAYVSDDHFARLSHVAIWNTRQTEFGYEMPYAGRLSYGGTIVGPPAETTWLRLTHRTDESREHEIQASTSTDGETWVQGGVWTFPAGSDIKVGLVSHGGAGATASFDYLRFYRDDT